MRANKKILPLPFPVYFWTVIAIAIAGLADAVYLAVSHYRVYTDMGYKSFCAVSKSINCDTVSQSPFSIFLNVPVPIWGVVGYLCFLMLLIPARRTSPGNCRLWPSLFVIALCFSLYSIYLSIISTRYIHSYCIMCIASYGVNFALLYFTWLIQRRFGQTSMISGLRDDFHLALSKKKTSFPALSAPIVIAAALISAFPAYWEISGRTSISMPPHGFTDEGHPWIGAENPELIITEFSDYQCFQCRKMHFYLRELLASHPGKIRMVHRNFPMDHACNPLVKEPYHIGSGKMALLSLYAAEKKKFWEINDMLFHIDTRKGHFNIREMAKKAGFDVYEFAAAVNDKKLHYKLRSDILDGMRLGVSATPVYVINGKIFTGHVPAEIINGILK